MSKKTLITQKTLGLVMMTIAILVYSVIPPMVDLITDTHVFHPDWPAHARFHTVWLLGTTSAVGLFAIYLLWGSGDDTNMAIRIAGTLSVCILGTFMMSVMSMPLYGGALSDVGGVGPTVGGLDANLVVFTVDLGVLLYGWYLASNDSP